MVVMACHADQDALSGPGREVVAQQARVTVRCVSESLERLIARGFLAVVVPGGGRGKQTVYRVQAERGLENPVNGEPHSLNEPPNGEPGSPFGAKQGTSFTESHSLNRLNGEPHSLNEPPNGEPGSPFGAKQGTSFTESHSLNRLNGEPHSLNEPPNGEPGSPFGDAHKDISPLGGDIPISPSASFFSSGDEEKKLARAPREAISEALAQACEVKPQRLRYDKRLKFDTAVTALVEDGRTPDDVTNVFWPKWRTFWRCTKGGNRPPTPTEVVECWDQVVGQDQRAAAVAEANSANSGKGTGNGTSNADRIQQAAALLR